MRSRPERVIGHTGTDRPLRPAKDRSLGRPLPHQQANPTQATPSAHRCFPPQGSCGISVSFPTLSPTTGHVPTRYSPVRHWHCCPCDLHVLSMPPAFALSQDQTLRFIKPSSITPTPIKSDLLSHSTPTPNRSNQPSTNTNTA